MRLSAVIKVFGILPFQALRRFENSDSNLSMKFYRKALLSVSLRKGFGLFYTISLFLLFFLICHKRAQKKTHKEGKRE